MNYNLYEYLIAKFIQHRDEYLKKKKEKSNVVQKKARCSVLKVHKAKRQRTVLYVSKKRRNKKNAVRSSSSKTISRHKVR